MDRGFHTLSFESSSSGLFQFQTFTFLGRFNELPRGRVREDVGVGDGAAAEGYLVTSAARRRNVDEAFRRRGPGRRHASM